MLVALAAALVITVAAASALVTVLRAERGLWARRRAVQQAESWLAARYAGRAEDAAVQLRYVEAAEKQADWQWLTGQPAADAPAMATVWIRAPAAGPVR